MQSGGCVLSMKVGHLGCLGLTEDLLALTSAIAAGFWLW